MRQSMKQYDDLAQEALTKTELGFRVNTPLRSRVRSEMWYGSCPWNNYIALQNYIKLFSEPLLKEIDINKVL